MNAPFPFGFPFPTAFYLTLYVVTLVVHVLFMNYVLAGCGYVLFDATRSFFAPRKAVDPLAALLRDWLPFATSAAITAGVAPLLFLQVLYQPSFYTANLLLFHRWMAILPVLIVGFYLLYLLKTRRLAGASPLVRTVVAAGAFACFAFTAYSWTENHLLSLDAKAWPALYASGRLGYYSPQLLPRLALWAIGSIPTLVTLAAWQFALTDHVESSGRPDTSIAKLLAVSPRHLATIALAGLGLSVVCGGLYWQALGDSSRSAIVGPLGRAYGVLAVVGILIQLIGWLVLGRRRSISPAALAVASAGLVLTILSATVLRETIRLASLDMAVLYSQHADAARVGGFSVFVVCFALNAALIGASVYLARYGPFASTRRP